MRSICYKTAIGALIVALAVSSCRGSADSGDGSTEKIKLMVIADTQSPVLSLPQVNTGAQAAVKEINAAGGVNGHQIQLLTCNSQANPNAASSCAREAVSNKVSAVIGLASLASNVVLQVLQGAGIPAIGGHDINTLDHTSPMAFPLASNTVMVVGSVLAMPGYKDCKHPATITDSAPANVSAGRLVAKLFRTLNPRVNVKTVTVSDTATDIRPQVATLVSSGSDCVIPIAPPQTVLSVMKNIYATGKKVKISESAANTPVESLKELGPAGQGVYGVTGFALPGTSTAGDKFAAAMAREDPKAVADLNAQTAYVGVHLFADAARSLTDFSAANIVKALNNGQNFSAPTIADIAFPKDSGIPGSPRVNQTKIYPYVFEGHNWKRVSADPIDVTPVLERILSR